MSRINLQGRLSTQLSRFSIFRCSGRYVIVISVMSIAHYIVSTSLIWLLRNNRATFLRGIEYFDSMTAPRANC